MKKLLAVFIVSKLFSPVIAYSDGNTSLDSNGPSTFEHQEEKTVFSQVYTEYRSGIFCFVAGALVAIEATTLTIRHYFQKSSNSSLKEFIGEKIL